MRKYTNRAGFVVGQAVEFQQRTGKQTKRQGTVVDVLPTAVCIRFLMSLSVGQTVYENVGYNEAWFDNDQVRLLDSA